MMESTKCFSSQAAVLKEIYDWGGQWQACQKFYQVLGPELVAVEDQDMKIVPWAGLLPFPC